MLQPGRRNLGQQLRQLDRRRMRRLKKTVVVRQFTHLRVSRVAQLGTPVADVHAPQPGHAVEDPVAVAVPEVHPVGAGDDPGAFPVQCLGVGERVPVVAAVVLLVLAGRA